MKSQGRRENQLWLHGAAPLKPLGNRAAAAAETERPISSGGGPKSSPGPIDGTRPSTIDDIKGELCNQNNPSVRRCASRDLGSKSTNARMLCELPPSLPSLLWSIISTPNDLRDENELMRLSDDLLGEEPDLW